MNNRDFNAALHVPLPPGDDDFEPGHQQGQQQGQQQGPQYGQQQFPGMQPFMFPWQMYTQPQVNPTPCAQPHRVRLVPLWTQKVKMWFSLAESSFDSNYISDSRMRFNLVLAALSEDTLDRVKALVELPDQLADPYQALKARLIEIYEPDVWESAARLLYMRELGDLQPSQLMDKMLALLPTGEQPGILFKSIFLARLPGDMRDHVQASAEQLDCRALASLADNIWRARNARKPNLMAALPEALAGMSLEEEEAAPVTAVNVKRGKQQYSKQGFRRKKDFVQVCWKHQKFGEKATSCVDSQLCTWKAPLN